MRGSLLFIIDLPRLAAFTTVVSLLPSLLSPKHPRTMAGYGDCAANNGFGRRSLHQWEGRLLYMAGYPAPPDFRALGGWRLSAGGVLILPPPVGDALDAMIKTLSNEQRAESRFFRSTPTRTSGLPTSTSIPPTRGRSSGTLVIREGTRASSSPARGRKRKPKKEDAAAVATSDLAAAEAARAEDAAVREAIARSLQDLVPADNALPMDAALAWSRRD
jgi:hypothetical protein